MEKAVENTRTHNNLLQATLLNQLVSHMAYFGGVINTYVGLWKCNEH